MKRKKRCLSLLYILSLLCLLYILCRLCILCLLSAAASLALCQSSLCYLNVGTMHPNLVGDFYVPWIFCDHKWSHFYACGMVARVRRQAPPQKKAEVWENREKCAYWEAPRRRLSRPAHILQKLWPFMVWDLFWIERTERTERTQRTLCLLCLLSFLSFLCLLWIPSDSIMRGEVFWGT